MILQMSTLTFCTTICIMKEVESAANSDWYIRLKIATSSKIHSNVSDAIIIVIIVMLAMKLEYIKHRK